MSTNLRISLTILSIGFAIEGGGEAYSLLTAGSFLPGTSLLFLLPAVVTLLGLLFILIGRHEWDELHRARVRRANLIFALSLLAGFVAGIEVTLLAAYPGVGAPLWAEVVFGAAVGSFLLGTFVTYAQLVFHLVTRPSKVALVASIAWALIVSALIAQTLAADLPSILGLIGAHSFSFEYPDLAGGLSRVVPVRLVLSPSRGVRGRPRHGGPAACGVAGQGDRIRSGRQNSWGLLSH